MVWQLSEREKAWVSTLSGGGGQDAQRHGLI